MSVYPPTGARDVWDYPTRTLTEYKRTASIIRNRDYVNSRFEDLLHANAVRMGGLVTVSDLAIFINYGVANLAYQDVWASIINSNPYSLWPAKDVADIFNDAGLNALSISKILRSTYMSADRAQSILYQMVDSGYYDKIINIITCDAPDESITANTTYTTGVNIRRNLSVASGVTLTLAAAPGVIIADTVNNSGVIESNTRGGAGGAPGADGAGAGGAGGGSVIIITRTITIGTVNANGANGGSGSTVGASGSGGAGVGGVFWIRSGDVVPNGGNGGYSIGYGRGNPNGGGGGGGFGGAGGAGGAATVTSFTNSQALVKELLKCTIDWWLQYIVGKTPSSVKSFPNLGGSGGGGGVAGDTYSACGGGGGGGGEIIIIGMNVTAGTLNAAGGNGGDGGAEGAYDSGGGGGGGGVCYVFYKSLTGTMTFNVAGGAGGTGDYNGAAGGTGIGVAEAI